MTIAIFGDSFTRRSSEPEQRGQMDLSWPEWLVGWGHQVHNFGQGATGLWFTYQLFLQHHHHYDRVIVTVTESSRQPIRGFTEISTNGAENLQWQLDNRSWTDNQRRALTAARDHVMWAQDEFYCQHIHTMLVERLQALRPDAVFIPCFLAPPIPQGDFWGKGTPVISGWQGHTMWDISDLDHQHFDLDLVKITADHRHCHMNEYNNRQFAQEIQTWLNQGTPPLRDLGIYQRPSRARSHYFSYKD